ncbi:MAG: class I SAM-dependent methyltransferase [Methanosphaera sp.]|uniref:class I SAM-dependent methyltransferase n=1 Tax=Methanosphaera sp. ISO3-F5 TaxID=1452353 RepID=UPI002B25D929|nr:class I SAM-dependent methyltransferase [Methanosphaera sp. ISO3-F5]MBR0472163.1 class I SAM-dependent methyltransferase [Methanosphaera sp.]WQH65003.1 class I SAM-dependent methyltransferase [Methanosphaera sp. ISO3-F5]
MIHISYDRRKYQEDMINNIETFDNVVEIGCHIGVSTKIISRLNQDGTVYAFDNSPESSEAMKNLGIEYNNIIFTQADVRDENVLYDLMNRCENIDVLCVDLGGGYHPDTVFKVFFIWSSVLKPRVTLIRNRGLIDFINSSVSTEEIKSDEGFLESSANEIKPNNLNELKYWSDKL